MIIVAIIIFAVSGQQEKKKEDLKCKDQFLNAYNIDGESAPLMRSMYICPGVKFSCCNQFDELRFHKNWFNYYEPKYTVTQQRAVLIFESLGKMFQFFRTLDMKGLKIPVKNSENLEKLLGQIKKIKLDPGLRPLINLLPKIFSYEKTQKQQFFCALCDFNNHEFLSDSSGQVILQQQDCEVVLSNWDNYLKVRNLLLNPVLVSIHKLIHQFDVDYYRLNDRSWVKQIQENASLVKKCYPDSKATFKMASCSPLCTKYSLTGFSETFFGEFQFYQHLLEVYEEFKTWFDKVNSKEKA